MKQALLIIDLQQGLFEQTPADFTKTISNVNLLISQAENYTVPVIFIQHEKDGSPLEYNSPGWQLLDELAADGHHHRIRKTSPDSFLRTDLNSLLVEHGIQQLIICGYASEFCVDTTVRSAAAHGYHILLAADAHTTHDKEHMDGCLIREHHNLTLSSIKSFNVAIDAQKTATLLQLFSN